MAETSGTGNGPIMAKDKHAEKAGRARRAARWTGDKLTTFASVLPGGRWTVKGQARREERLEMERQKRKEKLEVAETRKPGVSSLGNQTGDELGDAPNIFNKEFAQSLMRGYDLAPNISDPVVMDMLRTVSDPQFFQLIEEGAMQALLPLPEGDKPFTINLKTPLEKISQRYESSMKEVRKNLAQKLARGAFNEISTHELDIIFAAMAGTCTLPGTNTSVWSGWSGDAKNPTDAFTAFLEMVAKNPNKNRDSPGKFIASVVKFLVEKSSLVNEVNDRVRSLNHREGLIDEGHFSAYLTKEADIDGFLGSFSVMANQVLSADSSVLVELELPGRKPGKEEKIVLPGFGLSANEADELNSELHDGLRAGLLEVLDLSQFEQTFKPLDSLSPCELPDLTRIKNAVSAGFDSDSMSQEQKDALLEGIKKQCEFILPKTRQELDSTMRTVQGLIGQSRLDEALDAMGEFEKIHQSGFEKMAKSLLGELKTLLAERMGILSSQKMTPVLEKAREKNEREIRDVINDLRTLDMPEKTKKELHEMLNRLSGLADSTRAKSQERAIQMADSFIFKSLPSDQKLDDQEMKKFETLRQSILQRKNHLATAPDTRPEDVASKADSAVTSLVPKLGFDQATTDRLLKEFLGHGNEERALAILAKVESALSKASDTDAMECATKIREALIERSLAQSMHATSRSPDDNQEVLLFLASGLGLNTMQRELKATLGRAVSLSKKGQFTKAKEEVEDFEARMKTPLTTLANRILKPYLKDPEQAKRRGITQADWIIAYNTFRGRLSEVKDLSKVKMGWPRIARMIAWGSAKGVAWLFGVLPIAYYEKLVKPVWNRLRHFPLWFKGWGQYRRLKKQSMNHPELASAKKGLIEHRQRALGGLGLGGLLTLSTLWAGAATIGWAGDKDHLIIRPGFYSPVHGEVFRWPWHKKSFMNPKNWGYDLSGKPTDPADAPVYKMLPQDLAKASDHTLRNIYGAGNVLPEEAAIQEGEDRKDAKKRAAKLAQARMDWLREDNLQPSPWQAGVKIPSALTFLEEMGACNLQRVIGIDVCKNQLYVEKTEKGTHFVKRSTTNFDYVLKAGERVDDKTVVDRFVNELMQIDSGGKKITLAYLRENIQEWYAKGYLWRTVDAKYASAARIQKQENADFLDGNPVLSELTLQLANIGAHEYYLVAGAPDRFVDMARQSASSILEEKDAGRIQTEGRQMLPKMLKSSGLDDYLRAELRADEAKPDAGKSEYLNWVRTYLNSTEQDPATLIKNLDENNLGHEKKRLAGALLYAPLVEKAKAQGLLIKKEQEYRLAQTEQRRAQVRKKYGLASIEDIDFVWKNPKVYVFLDTLSRAKKDFVLRPEKANQFISVLREHVQKGGKAGDFDPNSEPVGKMVAWAVNRGYIIDWETRMREDNARLSIAEKQNRINELAKERDKIKELIAKKTEERNGVLRDIGKARARIEKLKNLKSDDKTEKDFEEQALQEGLIKDYQKALNALDKELDALRGEELKANKKVLEKGGSAEFWAQNDSAAGAIEGIVSSLLNDRGRKRFAHNNPKVVDKADPAKEANQKITTYVLDMLYSEIQKKDFQKEHGLSIDSGQGKSELKLDYSRLDKLKSWIKMVLSF